jgi:alpha-D-xyloside xylohydrolase
VPTAAATPTTTDSFTPLSTGTATPLALATLGAEFTLVFDAPSATLSVQRRGDALLRLPADALQLGRVDALDDRQNYDPYPIVRGEPLFMSPRGLRFLSVTKAAVRHTDARSMEIGLQYEEGARAVLRARLDGPGRFALQLVPDAAEPAIAFFRLRLRVDPAEGFYGLGEYFDSVNHRGHVRAMQLELDGEIESLNNEAHVPIPFLIGTRGWGVFVESPYPGVFDVAAQSPELVEITFGTGLASADGLAVHLFAADHPLDVTKLYYDVTGYPVLPARWALGPWIWRDESDDQAQVESDLETIRALDLATSAYWIDRPYASGVNSFDFEPLRFPDPARMIARMHELGFRTALWHTPYVDDSDPATADLLSYATANGLFPPRTALLLNNWGKPVDFTNPAAYAWWQELIRRYTEMGIEGFKLDYGEDVVPGIAGTRNLWRFHDGSDERTMHSRFQLFYHRVYAETLPVEGGFLLCRHATYGSQRYASVIWPGDLDASFALHREVIGTADDAYTAVGGLPASVVAGLSLGPSGFPFYGADTGGYRHSPPDKETFTRWFEQTALSSVMQIGTSTNNVAWEFSPETGFDEEMLGWYRTYTRLHLRLFPYEWTYAQRIAVDGRPIQRALGLAYPELGVHPSDTYLFGDHLLVAPVLRRGIRQREVLLPPGSSWVDWWTGEVHAGGQTIAVDAPLDTLPLFLRSGGIVPLLRPSIDTLAPTTAPERVDSYATDPGPLYPRLAPGNGSFVLFDGSEIRQTADARGMVVATKSGDEFRSFMLLEVIAVPPIASVSLDATPLAAAADLATLEGESAGWTAAPGGTLFIKMPPGEHEAHIDFATDPPPEGTQRLAPVAGPPDSAQRP